MAGIRTRLTAFGRFLVAVFCCLLVDFWVWWCLLECVKGSGWLFWVWAVFGFSFALVFRLLEG